MTGLSYKLQYFIFLALYISLNFWKITNNKFPKFILLKHVLESSFSSKSATKWAFTRTSFVIYTILDYFIRLWILQLDSLPTFKPQKQAAKNGYKISLPIQTENVQQIKQYNCFTIVTNIYGCPRHSENNTPLNSSCTTVK